MKKYAVVLAAGKGVRMKSDLPKVSHKLAGKPMIARVLDALKGLDLDGTFVVVGYKAEVVKSECEGFDVTFVEQKEQLGTGHAVMQAAPHIPQGSLTLVLNGDVPMIKTRTLSKLIDSHISQKASATVLTVILDDPHGYGRIVRSPDGKLEKIVEQKDANARELAIREINTGTYCFDSTQLFTALNKVKPNNIQKEYYLTDVIGIMNGKGLPVLAFTAEDATEALGVNTLDDLAKLEALMKNAVRH
jgi:bifunctional UDP-N-acetylglucosamine pyrophosphorylase / glucosamine-1-phosphate N-acetyltransferase